MSKHSYKLKPAELSLLEYAAQQRQAVWDDRAYAVDRRTHKRGGNVNLHLIGVCGEYVVASMLGVEMHHVAGEYGDDGYDLNWQGWRIDVKTRRSDIHMTRTVGGVDLYVQVEHHWPRPVFDVLGWFSVEDWRTKSKEVTRYGRRVRELRRDQLRPIYTLQQLGAKARHVAARQEGV